MLTAYLQHGRAGEPMLTESVEIKAVEAPYNRSRIGYGSKIPSGYMVRYNSRWQRVYSICYSNCSTEYILSKGSRILVQINDYLSENLNLCLKGNYQVFPIEERGLDFVGYVIRPDYVLIRKSIKTKFTRKARRLKKKGVDEKTFKQKTSGWYGWCKHANAINLLKKYSYDSIL